MRRLAGHTTPENPRVCAACGHLWAMHEPGPGHRNCTEPLLHGEPISPCNCTPADPRRTHLTTTGRRR